MQTDIKPLIQELLDSLILQVIQAEIPNSPLLSLPILDIPSQQEK